MKRFKTVDDFIEGADNWQVGYHELLVRAPKRPASDDKGKQQANSLFDFVR